MFENGKSELAFAAPIARYTVTEYESLNADLMTEGKRMRPVSEGLSKSNKGGWHSNGNIFNEAAPF
jgi:hypothetical protein